MISGQPTVKTYTCTGSRDFCFPYRIIEAGDLLVQRLDAGGHAAELPADKYEVAGVGADAGVTVTTEDTFTDGKIRIWLKLEAVQPNAYENNTPFPAQSHEDALDRMTLLNAMRREEFMRTLSVPFGEPGLVLPEADERAGRFFAFNGAGDVVTVPAIADPIVIQQMDQATVYFDRNPDLAPRLFFDVCGLGSTLDPQIGAAGAIANSTAVFQDVVPLENQSCQRFFFGVRFQGQPVDGPQVGFDNRRSRFAVGIASVSEIGVQPDAHNGDDQDSGDDVYYAQEAGGLSVTATAKAGTANAKVEGIVVSAREEAGIAPGEGSKGVAVQAITVRTTAGPPPDDRTLLTDSEDGDGDSDGADAFNFGSITLRLNAGTVKVAEQPVFGGYRSWCAMMASGRAGYFNGVVLKKMHTNMQEGDTDPEEVGGWGGVGGGRGFWHETMFATYCKEGMEGWVCIGHDGVPDPNPTGDGGLARAPIDIVAAGDTAVMFNGQKVLGAQDTGWTAMGGAAAANKGALNAHTGSSASASYDQAKLQGVMDDVAGILARLKAYDQMLLAHGLISTAT